MPAPYPLEFRSRAVELAREKKAPIAQIASEQGISESTLRNWLARAEVEEGRKEDLGRGELTTFRLARAALALLSVAAIAFAMYWAFLLTRQAGQPPAAGTARLLIPGNSFSRSDQFQLDFVTNHPATKYVEYHITTDCNDKARIAILMLSGNARLTRYLIGPESDLGTERTANVGAPWFLSPQPVQVFTLRLMPTVCPAAVQPSQFGTTTFVAGFVAHSYEDAAGSSHALQLPLVGDETQVDSDIPALGGFWVAPLLTATAHRRCQRRGTAA